MNKSCKWVVPREIKVFKAFEVFW